MIKKKNLSILIYDRVFLCDFGATVSEHICLKRSSDGFSTDLFQEN